MNDKAVLRIRVISYGLLVLFLFVSAKLYLVQVVRGESYAEKADRQYVKPSGSLFDRGSIYFETKDGSLITAAGLKNGFTLSVNPTRVVNAEGAYQRLSKLYKLDYADFMAKATKKNDPYEELGKRLEPSVGSAIYEEDIPGIDVYKDRWRYYPGGETASQVLGFLSFKDDKLGAHYGLESKYDNVLSRNGDNDYANFFTEILYGIKKHMIDQKSFEGDVVLTIEPTVQGYVEDAVDLVQKTWSSTETGAIVIDPKTGRIYAMAMAPTFDLNETSEVDDISLFANPIVQNVYEMGSIIKPLTVASGLDAGVITRDSTYDDRGSATFDKSTIYNYDKRARGVVTMQTALSQSLNTGMAHIVEKLGKEKFVRYMKSFGIDEKTGVDLPYESQPLVSNLDSTRMIEPVTASFGQGIALTPIGVVRALSVLANGGYVITPHLVSSVNHKIGTVDKIEFPKGEQVLKNDTSEEITRMLVEVVDKALLDGKIKMENYAIAAKTGTAQIPNPYGGYYDDRYLHSFFGYFPAYDPQFLVFMYTVYPKGVDYASHTLTDPFNDITEFLLSYYNVPPDR